MPRTAITILLALAACGPAAGPFTGGRAPSGPSTGSTGEPRSTATGDSTTSTEDGSTTSGASTTSGGSSGSSGSSDDDDSSSSAYDDAGRCSAVPVNPSMLLCVCHGIVVEDSTLCPRCALLPCEPIECEADAAGCWCDGHPADHELCEDAGSSDGTGGTG